MVIIDLDKLTYQYYILNNFLYICIMNYEKEYIQYLIDNQVLIDTSLLDNYFLDKIDFETLIESINPLDVKSYKSFVKSKNIDELLK